MYTSLWTVANVWLLILVNVGSVVTKWTIYNQNILESEHHLRYNAIRCVLEHVLYVLEVQSKIFSGLVFSCDGYSCLFLKQCASRFWGWGHVAQSYWHLSKLGSFDRVPKDHSDWTQLLTSTTDTRHVSYPWKIKIYCLLKTKETSVFTMFVSINGSKKCKICTVWKYSCCPSELFKWRTRCCVKLRIKEVVPFVWIFWLGYMYP